MEFKQLQEVNKKLQTIDIKGKDYVEVNKRIMAFRELYPDGMIMNEIVSNENGMVIIKCTVIGDTEILAVAHAYEKEGAGFINKTSYIENCETSAVGRALGMLGIGVDTSVASYEEVANAIKQQEPKARDELIKFLEVHNLDMKEVAKDYKLNSKSTDADFNKVLKSLKEGMNE